MKWHRGLPAGRHFQPPELTVNVTVRSKIVPYRKILFMLSLSPIVALADIAPSPALSANSLPEPSSILLLGLGMAGMLLVGRKRR
jgi:hypothetical protein